MRHKEGQRRSKSRSIEHCFGIQKLNFRPQSSCLWLEVSCMCSLRLGELTGSRTQLRSTEAQIQTWFLLCEVLVSLSSFPLRFLRISFPSEYRYTHVGTMFTELSPYSPLRTESSTNHTPTPTVNAMDAAITAQTNFTDGVELGGDFFLFLRDDNLTVLIDERDDLQYRYMYVIDRSTNASAAEFILDRLKLYLAGRHHHHPNS